MTDYITIWLVSSQAVVSTIKVFRMNKVAIQSISLMKYVCMHSCLTAHLMAMNTLTVSLVSSAQFILLRESLVSMLSQRCKEVKHVLFVLKCIEIVHLLSLLGGKSDRPANVIVPGIFLLILSAVVILIEHLVLSAVIKMLSSSGNWRVFEWEASVEVCLWVVVLAEVHGCTLWATL